MLAYMRAAGETPVAECLEWIEQRPQLQRRSPGLAAELLAMTGRFDEAHAALAAAEERRAEIGSEQSLGYVAQCAAVAGLEGDWAATEAAARLACELSEAQTQVSNFQLFSCERAAALIELERFDEAARCLERAEDLAPSDEREPRVKSRALWARLLAKRGETAEAERLAREAVALAEATDMPNLRGEARLALAAVLVRAGKNPRPELEQALADYERKGNLVMAGRTRALLAKASAPA
jgi:tetratricopeptide (TPR) repeat protein